MAGEGGGEAERLAGVGADGLHAEAEEPGLRQVGGGGRADTRGVRAVPVGVGEGRRVVAAGRPAGPKQQPAAVRQRPVLLLPVVEVLDVEQVVRVLGCFLHLVDDDGRADELVHRDLGDVFLVLAGDPVVRGVQVRTRVLAGADVVPVPGGTAVVVAADFLKLEGLRLPPLRRKLQDRRVGVQWRGEVNDLDLTGEKLRCELGKVGHGSPFGVSNAATVLASLAVRQTSPGR